MERPPSAEQQAEKRELEEGREGENEVGGEEEDGACSDQELDELLNFSLGEFGKHLPTVTSSETQNKPPDPSVESGCGSGRSQGGRQGASNAPATSEMQDFEDIFSEEFAAQAQAQLGDTMKILSKEDPQLWQQLQGFSDAASTNFQPSTLGREGGEGRGGSVGSEERGSVEATLEDTLRRLRESTEQIEASSGVGGEGGEERLSQLLSQLGEGGEEGEEGEEGLVKMMEGMMSTLLSRDVLYPSLSDICKQYPDWLSSQKDSLSPEDYTRYCKQLEIMRAICQEFERQEEGERREGEGMGAEGGKASAGGSNDRILQLMQQLQQYGQPPPEIAGDGLPQGGLPGFPPFPLTGGPMPTDCSIM